MSDFIPQGMSTSREEIAKNSDRRFIEELRRGFEMEDQQPEQVERRRVAQARAAADTVQTVRVGNETVRVDDPRFQAYVQTASMFPQTRYELQQMIQRQSERTLKDLGSQFPDVFNDYGRARLAAVHAQELREQDAARGVVRPDREVLFQAAEQTRKLLRGRKGR